MGETIIETFNERAAEMGDVPATFELALLLAQGKGVEKNREAAAKLFDDAERALIADYENDQTRAAIAKAIVDGVKLNSVDGLSDEAQAGKERILALAAGA